MIHRLTALRRLRRDNRGTAITEFALMAPLFLLILMGIFDYSWQMYGKQVLAGAVAKAARAATLESAAGSQTTLDAAVRKQVKLVFKDANVTFDRKSYDSYDEIGDPENYTDSNKNGRYDKGECFQDVNGNGSWDSDRGKTGNGGAEDVVVYTASMKITRVLPVWRMLGQPQESTIHSSTVLRNQPYAAATATSTVICT
ncbi:TadE family protein [Sphingopyxis sp. KK2]|uniref:TadE family protein n=1 Tax=Sphingopyxis sp. KK2 TaxID=1855727 RepID=UPI00097E5E00|nr:TadE/TadG family type IV pilus assembly protein [Sphingopyxis sp. KK2]